MPEGYTHIRTARNAAQLAKLSIADEAAFGCGANGPDILFCYRAWKKGEKRGENLPQIGDRLHSENTGAMLQALIEASKTPQERSYTMGFLCHYATDCVLHPYVVMITKQGQLYGMPGGHGYFEIGLDSWLNKQDNGTGVVTADDNTPKLSEESLDAAANLLQVAIQKTLGIQLSKQALTDTFAHTRLLRSMVVSRCKLKYILFWLVEPLFGKRGFITGHVTPAKLKTPGHGVDGLPTQWVNPFTGQQCQQSILDLLDEAARRSAAYMLAAQGYWDGKLDIHKVMELVGSNNYLSGLPDAQSAPDFCPTNP